VNHLQNIGEFRVPMLPALFPHIDWERLKG